MSTPHPFPLLCFFSCATANEMLGRSHLPSPTDPSLNSWPESAREAFRAVQDQLTVQRSQLRELQKRVFELTQYVATPVNQRKPLEVFSSPFRNRLPSIPSVWPFPFWDIKIFLNGKRPCIIIRCLFFFLVTKRSNDFSLSNRR